jgi:membrane protein required for colicin V production
VNEHFALLLSNLTFKPYDLFVILFLVLGIYRGYQKGFVIEIISSLAFVFSLIICFKLLHWGFDYTKVNFGGISKSGPFFSFLFFFFGIAILINILGRKLASSLEYTIFESFDNFLGGCLGLLKYFFGLSLLAALLTFVGLIKPGNDMANTFFYPLLMGFFNTSTELLGVVMPFISDLVRDVRAMLR